MINISNFTNKDKPTWPAARPPGRVQPAAPAAPAAPSVSSPATAERAARRQAGVRLGYALVITAGVLLSWLDAIPRRLGDRLFAMNDNEAYWRGWQITGVQGGLGRRYRDPRFGTLAECGQCQGAGYQGTGRNRAGAGTKALCARCDGTGRITLGEVS